MVRFAVLLFLLSAFMVNGSAMVFSGSDYQSYGVVEPVDTLVLTEDVLLSGNAILTFYNMTLNMAPTADWEYRIEVKDNARLVLELTAINVPTQKKLRINVTDNGTLEIRDSSIRVTEFLIKSNRGFHALITSINASTIVFSDSTVNSKLLLGLYSPAIEVRNSNLFNNPAPQPSQLIMEGGVVQVTDSVIENRLNQNATLKISGDRLTILDSRLNNTAITQAKVSLSSSGPIGIASSEFYSISSTNESELAISGTEVTFQEALVKGKGKYSYLSINCSELEISESRVLINGTEETELRIDSEGGVDITDSEVLAESEDLNTFELTGKELDIDKGVLSAVAERRLGTLSQMRLSFDMVTAVDSQLKVQDGSSSGIVFVSSGRLENTTVNGGHSLFQDDIILYGDNSIDVYWHALIKMEDLRGDPISGATVTVTNPFTYQLVAERWTDSNGRTSILLAGEQITPGQDAFLGNYKLKITYGDEADSKSITLDRTQEVSFLIPVQLRTHIEPEKVNVSGLVEEEEVDQTVYWIALVLGFGAVGLALLEMYVKAKHKLEARKSSKEYLKKMKEKEREEITGPKLEL